MDVDIVRFHGTSSTAPDLIFELSQYGIFQDAIGRFGHRNPPEPHSTLHASKLLITSSRRARSHDDNPFGPGPNSVAHLHPMLFPCFEVPSIVGGSPASLPMNGFSSRPSYRIGCRCRRRYLLDFYRKVSLTIQHKWNVYLLSVFHCIREVKNATIGWPCLMSRQHRRSHTTTPNVHAHQM